MVKKNGRIPTSLGPRSIRTRPLPDPRCKLCHGGSDPIPLMCWQCTFLYHTHYEAIALVPILRLTMINCPIPECRAENVFMRVPPPDLLVNGNTDADQPKSIWWG